MHKMYTLLTRMENIFFFLCSKYSPLVSAKKHLLKSLLPANEDIQSTFNDLLSDKLIETVIIYCHQTFKFLKLKRLIFHLESSENKIYSPIWLRFASIMLFLPCPLNGMLQVSVRFTKNFVHLKSFDCFTLKFFTKHSFC